ncbi:MAG: hypothetical protein LBV19_09035 [Streptococcaceae bacterium]|jgi:hypothetical protein|nr:hypothetical protein [Streptococcaceae bacterium]
MKSFSSFPSGVVAGVIVGIIIAILIRIYFKKRKQSSQKYDERQIIQRGQSALHTLIFALSLLVLSSLLNESIPHWLTITTQNILIILLSGIFYLVEQMARGAYFGLNFAKKSLLGYYVIGIAYTAGAIFYTAFWLLSGKLLMISGSFTLIGFMLLVYWYVALVYSLALIGWRIESKKTNA